MNPEPTPASDPGQGRQPRLGLAIASLVLGIVALLLSFVLIGVVLGLVGLTLGIVHLRQPQQPRGMAIGGVALSILAILASIGFAAFYYAAYQKFKSAAAEEGDGSDAWQGVAAPDITITTLDGSTIKLSDLKGKRVVLDFWATWCPPCVKEIPHFIKLRSEVSTNELVIIGLSEEERSVLEPFIKKRGINYPIASTKDLPSPYSDVTGIPTTFFIDRKGIIQSVLVGYHDFEDLREYAIASDYEGESKSPPDGAKGELNDSDRTLKPTVAWTITLPGARGLCTGDWNGDGTSEVLVTDDGKTLHIISADGSALAAVTLPEAPALIELGRHKTGGPRLLGYSNWGKQVSVFDGSGKMLWSYPSKSGVDGAHWGDLDGDGTDELIVGMNGGGGLHAVSAEGKPLWKVTNLGNVWNQAVISATGTRESRVFATEAMGSIKVYDGGGKLLKTLRPRGKYFSQMNAAVVDGQQAIQIMVTHEGFTMALDPSGKEAWSTTGADQGGWRAPSFASGDVDGDGVVEWAFLEQTGEVSLVTASGERRSVIPGQTNLKGFALLAMPKAAGLFVSLTSGKLTTYRFE